MGLHLMSLCFLLFVVGINGKATFSDCGGSNKKLSLQDGAVNPDPIQYPGNVSVNANLEVYDDLPASLFMKLELTKLEPKAMHVPCLDGFGSCEYDICKMVETYKSELCPSFPPGVPCACPLKKATYNIRNALVALPNLGDIFIRILKGNYSGNMTFFDKDTKAEIGCVNIGFQIVPRNP